MRARVLARRVDVIVLGKVAHDERGLEDNRLMTEERGTAAGEPQLADGDWVGYHAHIPRGEAVETSQENQQGDKLRLVQDRASHCPGREKEYMLGPSSEQESL